MTQRHYAIGDIHGHLDKLEGVHQLIEMDRVRTGDADAPVIHIGDLVDRGPDSHDVLAYLIRGQARGEPWVVLKGNHDRMFEGYLNDPDFRDPLLRKGLNWRDQTMGGSDTLASYGVQAWSRLSEAIIHAQAVEKVPQTHRDFLAGLPYSYRAPGLFFVHAGIRPGVALDEQTPDDLCWMRRPFIDDSSDHGALIIHGHTPIDQVTHYGNRVNIDTGAGHGKRLSAIIIEDGTVFELGPEGRSDPAHV